MKRLNDRVVLVTGAARGMGRSHCERVADEGADVIALDLEHHADELAVTSGEVVARSRRCVTGFADVRDPRTLADLVAEGVARLGRIDAVVANAGVYPNAQPSWELDETQWRTTLDVNLTGIWNTVRAAHPYLRAGGSVVLVSSTNGVKGSPGTSHYCASKHGVIGLGQTLANELGNQGIRVNTVLPGSVGTSMILNDNVFGKLCPDLDEPGIEHAAAVLATRTLLDVAWVDPVDVSNAVVFLLSDEARYITGINVPVDAGLLARTS
ncbi:putative oxidoreductase, short-chain dehydrogenase/reductase family [Gordonia polyisoprenivorans VH2]|uniref:Putative oxidoreductase, short-chain dehydrogenase/reductase family n=1 Tax=Gordonia polyisoprenivorans (strain DSM 44266 / VH2) TaxID=1112204 RepID=H6MT18_GORPV|nr:mycofactocin-coupled SDR family oxidoreductase [Gordonia polyisoprenivorans]AFA75139.1 putative oxidoreductase, short-chain dehydrogenase/reductase family [Gordonia polyisoprenivorans VH2]